MWPMFSLLLALACSPSPSAYTLCLELHELACECGNAAILATEGDTCAPSYADACRHFDSSVCDPDAATWDAHACEEYHEAYPDPAAVADELACKVAYVRRTCEPVEDGMCW